MAVSRSLGNLIVRLVAEGLGGYKADMNAAADVTKDAAGKIEASTSKAGKAAQVMGGQIGASSAEIEGLSAVVAVAGLGVTALAATFAVAGYAASQGAKEAKAYELALILTGNAAGVTRGQLADMAAGVSKVAGTQGQASAALIAMVNTGAVASENLQKFTLTAIEMERTVGQKVGDTVKQFAELGNEPVKASLKFNESMNYLTASTFEQIKAAQELGDKTTAASLAQNAFADAWDSNTKKILANQGSLEKAWLSLGRSAAWAWDKMMNLGRENGPEQALASQMATVENLKSQIAKRGSATPQQQQMLGAAEQTLGTMREEVKLGQKAAQAQAENAASTKAKINWMQEGDKYQSKEEKLTQTINRIRFEGNAAGASAVEIEKRITAEKEKSAGKGGAGGAGSTRVSDYTRLAEAMAKTGTLAEQELAYGGKLAASERYRIETLSKIESLYAASKISLQERNQLLVMTTETVGKLYLVEKLAYEVDAIKKNNTEVDRQNEAMTKTLTGMVSSNEQQRLNNETIGLTTEKLHELTLERFDAAIAEETLTLINLQNSNASAVEIANLERKIRLLKEQRNLTAAGQIKTNYAGVVSTLLPNDNKPAASAYDPREKALILGAETEKVAAYNATARAAIDAEQGRQTAILASATADGTATDKMLSDYEKLIAKNEEMRAKMNVNFKIAGLDDMSTQLGSMSATAGKLGDGFKGAASALGGVSRGLKTISDAQKDQAKTGRDSTAEQIGGYGEMAGAAKEMFDKNSAGYEIMAGIEKAMYVAKFAMQAMEIIGNLASGTSGAASTAMQIPGQIALAEVAGTVAILTQGEGDPYSAWIRMAAMAAAVAGILAAIGGSSGSMSGGGTGTMGSGGVVDSTGKVGAGRSSEIINPDNSAGAADIKATEDAAKALAELNAGMKAVAVSGSELEKNLERVQRAAQGAGAAQYELATQGMSESERAAYNYTAALEGQIAVYMDIANGTENASDNMRKLAKESQSLAIELMQAQGNIAGARDAQFAMDTAGYTSNEVAWAANNRDTKERIQAINDGAAAASAAASAEEQLAQTRLDLQGQIDVLIGSRTQLQVDRTAQLAGVTDGAVISLTNLLFALQDIDTEVTRLMAVADTAFATLQRAVKAEKDTITAAYKATTDARAAILKVETDTMRKITDLANALKSTLSGLDIGPDRASAQAEIASYLAIVKAGGPLPTVDAINPALKSIAKPSEQLFSTFVDYQRDFLRTANDISDLSKFADSQVSVEQQTLDAINGQTDMLKATYDAEMERLDHVLTAAQLQLDVLHGIDNSVISVVGAIEGMAAAFGAAQAAKDGAAAAKAAAVAANVVVPSVPVASGGGGWGGEEWSGADPEIAAAYDRYFGRYPDEGGNSHYLEMGKHGDDLLKLVLGGAQGNDRQEAINRGYDPSNPLAKFDKGINYVPYDMKAQIHQGERILPAADNRQLMARLSDPQSNNDALVAEIRALRSEVKKLQASSERGNENTQRTADTLSGRQGVPFLVQVAT